MVEKTEDWSIGGGATCDFENLCHCSIETEFQQWESTAKNFTNWNGKPRLEQCAAGKALWLTAAVTEMSPMAVACVGAAGEGPGKAELWCDSQKRLAFETSRPRDGHWKADRVELRYLHGGDIGASGQLDLPWPENAVYIAVRLRGGQT